jgi:hypothetical protein
MMTTNKLTKILCGAATLAIATAMAAPAQAIHFTVELDTNGNGFASSEIAQVDETVGVNIDSVFYDSVILGDKSFYNFRISGDVSIGDELRFILNNGVWTVNFSEETSLGVNNGTLQYEVDISDPKLVFDIVAFDTNISGPPGNENYLATRGISKLDNTPLITLTSTNGSQDFGSILSSNANTIKVIDTYTSLDNSSSLLQFSTNNLTQAQDPPLPEDQDPPPTEIPEPGTILGLLAVGGLGLVSRFKKQK